MLAAASSIFRAADPAGAARGWRARKVRRMAETILVVDDDPDISRFVEVNLRSAGYDVAVAGRRSAGPRAGRGAPAGPGPARRDDAAARRVRGRPAAARDPHTSASSIMLTAKAFSSDKVMG